VAAASAKRRRQWRTRIMATPKWKTFTTDVGQLQQWSAEAQYDSMSSLDL